jgi:hypothetical protein
MSNSERRTAEKSRTTGRTTGRQEQRATNRSGPGVGSVDQEYCDSLADLSDREKRCRIRALSSAELRELYYRWRAKAIDIKSQLASARVSEQQGRKDVDPEWRKNAKVALQRTEKDLEYIQELRMEGGGCVASEGIRDAGGQSMMTHVFLALWEELSEREFDDLAQKVWDRLSEEWKQEDVV